MNVIKLNGKVIAFSYNYHHNGYVLGMRLGYDSQYAKAGLGIVLYSNVIADSCQRDDHTIDMGPGSMGIKRDWMTRTAYSHHYTHYPAAALKAQILRVKHWIQSWREPTRSDSKNVPAGVSRMTETNHF